MKKHVSYSRLFILVLVPILATLLIFSDVSANYQIIKKKAPVLLMNLPDLIVESIGTDPKEIVEDGTLELKSVIRNIGTVEAKDFAIDFLLDGKAIHRWPKLILGPNQIFTAQIPKQVVRGIGTHNFACRADAENRVREKNETNNEKTVVFTIKKKSEEVSPPDIAVTLISINPLNPTTIDSIKFSVTIKNVGQKVLEDVPVSVGWRYKKKGETSWRDKSMFSNNIGRLAPGETMQVKEDTISFRIQVKKSIDSSLGKMLKNGKKEQMLSWAENNPDFGIRLFQFIYLQGEHSS